MNQLPLFEEGTARERAWAEFHRAHPEVYQLFARFALEALAGGRHSRIGARMVWERMRWEETVAPSEDRATWRLNDHHVPFYARHFLTRNPQLGQVFETRHRSAQETR